MRIVQNYSTPGHGMSMHEQHRRHDALVRKAVYQREAITREATLKASDKAKVDNAARALVNTYQIGKVSRQHIEEEQRADETRLKGWTVAKPQPGTIFADEPDAIRYRMAVRAKALEEITSLELAVMISTSVRNRDAATPPGEATPWRAGTGYGTKAKKVGKPIGLSEYNHCHSPEDGKFCSTGGGDETRAMVAKVAKATPDNTRDRVASVMDKMRQVTGAAPPMAKTPHTPVKLVTPRKGSVADMARREDTPTYGHVGKNPDGSWKPGWDEGGMQFRGNATKANAKFTLKVYEPGRRGGYGSESFFKDYESALAVAKELRSRNNKPGYMAAVVPTNSPNLANNPSRSRKRRGGPRPGPSEWYEGL